MAGPNVPTGGKTGQVLAKKSNTTYDLYWTEPDAAAVGIGLDYHWNGTQLGVKREDEVSYTYVNLIGPQGIPGNDGYTPVKGVDYFDGEQGIPGNDGYTPIKGVDYFDGEQGIPGNDGYTPIKGVDYFDGADGADGTNGIDGVTPHIGVNNNWYFGETDTGISALGIKGDKGDPGNNAPTVGIQFSVNGYSDWHYGYTSGDEYMRMTADGESTWTDAISFVGPVGATGATGLGMPAGGNAGQVPMKASSAEGDYIHGDFLPLSGGTLTGDLDIAGNALKNHVEITTSNGNTYATYPFGVSYTQVVGATQTTGENFPMVSGTLITVKHSEFRTFQILLGNGHDRGMYYREYHENLSGFTAWENVHESAADILTKIKTVDGSGSGLDADLFRGVAPSSFFSASEVEVGDCATNFKIYGTTTEGNTSFSTRYGEYVKIGDNVIIPFSMIISSKGTISGSLRLGPLPFISDATATSATAAVCANDIVRSGISGVFAQVVPNSTYASMRISYEASGILYDGALSDSHITSASYFRAILIYKAA